jgi:hypothetical protein
MKSKKLVLTLLTVTVFLVGLLASSISQAHAFDLSVRQSSSQSTKCVNGVCENSSSSSVKVGNKVISQKNEQSTKCVDGVCEVCVNGACENVTSDDTDGMVVQKSTQSTKCINGVCITVTEIVYKIDDKVVVCTLKTKNGEIVEQFCTSSYENSLEISGPPPCLGPPMFQSPTCLTQPTPPPLINKVKDMFKEKGKKGCADNNYSMDDDEEMKFGSLTENFINCIKPCEVNEFIDPCKIFDIERD